VYAATTHSFQDVDLRTPCNLHRARQVNGIRNPATT
jgi:hypothetical protein